MERGSPTRSLLGVLSVAAVSFLSVVVLFYFQLIPNHFEPSGYPREVPAIGIAYIRAMLFVYGPMAALVATAFDRLPVMGLGIAFASILTSVTLQNLLMWFGGKFLIERLRNRRVDSRESELETR